MLGNILPALEVDRSKSSEHAKLHCWRKPECATTRSFRKRCLRVARHQGVPLAREPRREQSLEPKWLTWSSCAFVFSVKKCVSNAIPLHEISACKQWRLATNGHRLTQHICGSNLQGWKSPYNYGTSKGD
jgi:hypothetical protein